MSSPTEHTDRSAPGASGPPNIQDMELNEEWQDDGFPRPLPEDDTENPAEGARDFASPTFLAQSVNNGGGAKKRLVAPTLSLTLNRRDSNDRNSFSAAALSGTPDDTPSLDINLEALETPSDSETGTLPDSVHDLEWDDDLPRMGKGGAVGVARSPVEQSEGLMELDQLDSRGRRWRRFCISGHEYQVNMSVLEPYLQVLSHGGYYGDGMNAIILFTSCYLPENTVEDYEYVMDNLFRYIVGTLDLMVSENYLLIYLCAMAPRNKLPSIKWLHQCYTSIDRRLKKDLKGLLVVHPAWYIKALITLVKPFISDKFSRKIRFVQSLEQLSELIPTDQLQIPDAICQFDRKLNR
ncbi:bcl-2/adenovirus E1B 19 kDa-interacting protein 2-like protein isoform X2 [Archocentrus centrarchus]|uniref:bcl-2/adenovirus E1B 19 kDa-interacting protein 2-like protein isoform X2 n=1 Tax=Archocentrus centrarchus TaxID=63155 RepID=UPI0011EA22F7|nr:BCL2/adenovirus E1B 19 kDa protein-interacting protein 2-like isoform X2 [Archocentrus centrarchus]